MCTIKSWKNNLDELVTFFIIHMKLEKIIYKINTIENLNRNFIKITKTKVYSTNSQSLSKIIYLCLVSIQENYD